MRRHFITVVLLALAGVLVWILRPRPAMAPPARAPARRIAAGAGGAGGRAVMPPHHNPNPPGPAVPVVDAPSHLADELNSPATDIRADLRLLNDIFMHYRSAVHGENPIGENADITAVLTGRNRLGFAFIPPNHPAINAQGELCDRWGTPFFFHQISGDEMGIRSAGPDRKMWTADDAVLTP